MIALEYYFIALILLLSLSFFFSCSETSLFSLSNIKLEEIKKRHPNRGLIIEKLLNDPQKLLVTILICNTTVNILATITASRIFTILWPEFELWILIIVMTFLVLIFGEVTPKSIAIKFAPRISINVAPILLSLSIILKPFIFTFRLISRLLVEINSFIFFRNLKENNEFEIDEMVDVISESLNKGIIEKEEGIILKNLIHFENIEIWKIMKPRNEIFSFPIDIEIGKAIEFIKEKKYSRIPVWQDNEENIIGILHIKEILKIKDPNATLYMFKNILRKPFFVPESMKVETLLKIFQTNNIHLALVIDEFGGISGLVTLEDLIETIIGDVIDKDDIKPLYYKYNSSMIEVEGRITIEEFNEVFNTNIKSKEAVTIAGFILENIRRIPKVGEVFNINNLQFRISEVQPNKIEKILITKLKNIKRGNKR